MSGALRAPRRCTLPRSVPLARGSRSASCSGEKRASTSSMSVMRPCACMRLLPSASSTLPRYALPCIANCPCACSARPRRRPPRCGTVDDGIEAVRRACAAGAGDAAFERAVPVRHEIAGIETVQLRGDIPAQRRRPRNVSVRVERATGRRGVQRIDRRPRRVAAPIEMQACGLALAQQRRVADRGPRVGTAGDAEVGIGTDLRRAVVPAQRNPRALTAKRRRACAGSRRSACPCSMTCPSKTSTRSGCTSSTWSASATCDGGMTDACRRAQAFRAASRRHRRRPGAGRRRSAYRARQWPAVADPVHPNARRTTSAGRSLPRRVTLRATERGVAGERHFHARKIAARHQARASAACDRRAPATRRSA